MIIKKKVKINLKKCFQLINIEFKKSNDTLYIRQILREHKKSLKEEKNIV